MLRPIQPVFSIRGGGVVVASRTDTVSLAGGLADGRLVVVCCGGWDVPATGQVLLKTNPTCIFDQQGWGTSSVSH